MRNILSNNTIRYSVVCFALLGLWLFAMDANAGNIGDMSKQLTKSFEGIAKLISAGSYLAGLGFAIGAIMKFKQHKDNPTQIPIGTPIALLFIAAAMLFFPTIISIAGASIFGDDAKKGGLSGDISDWN